MWKGRCIWQLLQRAAKNALSKATGACNDQEDLCSESPSLGICILYANIYLRQIGDKSLNKSVVEPYTEAIFSRYQICYLQQIASVLFKTKIAIFIRQQIIFSRHQICYLHQIADKLFLQIHRTDAIRYQICYLHQIADKPFSVGSRLSNFFCR